MSLTHAARRTVNHSIPTLEFKSRQTLFLQHLVDYRSKPCISAGRFSFLASFGNSIMPKLSRLDTLAADRAKAGFIFSISHELRSPLHRVLASIELLKEVARDITSIEIMYTIETLLDTMENLLTFAKTDAIPVNSR